MSALLLLALALTQVTGRLAQFDEKLMVVEAADGRVVKFERDAKTKFYQEGAEIPAARLKPGDEIYVEADEQKDGTLRARTVRLDRSAPPAEAAPASARDADDPGPPELRHGAAARPAAPETDDSTSAPPGVDARDPVIEKARAAAGAFSEKLPNYVCKEFMARFESATHPVDWKAVDVVSAEVVFDGVNETYRNVEVNGKPARKPMEEMGGTWSTGEFGSTLRDLFSPSTDAEFRYRWDSSTGGANAKIYDFSVERTNSHWHVQTQAQSLNPAYKGSVWIDPETGRARRIEMQARALPEEFPLDTIESAVDYANVRIGDGEFLLPVRAEVLSCRRGSSDCSRNTIDFRNYHQFSAKSDVTFSGERK
ncbi:MAG: hypothetical protein ACM336_17220 [Acidobacteriota bacterium]